MDSKDCILVVDDDEGTRKSLTFILRKKGYFVETAETGKEALAIAKGRPVNLTLLDIKLPDIEGVELLAPLKKTNPYMSIIMITGFASVESAVQSLTTGASGYITKPINLDELFARIKNALDHQHLVTEIRRAEEKIESLAKFPEENPNPVFRVASDGVLIYANKSSEFIINELKLSIETKVPEFLETVLKKAIECGSRLEIEKIVGEKTYLFTIAPIIGQNYVNLYGLDITERKRAIEELNISLAKYKVLFESLPIAITISDKLGNIIESNNRAEEILGLSPEEQSKRMIDGTEWQLIRPDGTPMPADEYASVRALKENRPVQNVEMGIVKGNSAVTWISVTAAPIPLKDHGVAIAYSDITERKEAEEKIKESFERFKTVLDGIDALVYVVDMETHNLLFINKYGKDVWGNIEGKVCWQTIQNDQSGPCPFCTNGRLVDRSGNPTGVYHWEFQNTVSHRWYDCRDSAIRWLDGHLVRLEIATDITGHKQAEEQLKRFNEELELAVKERTCKLDNSLHEKEILLKEIHHRVKNNLQIIISLLRLQKRQISDMATQQHILDSESRIRSMALVHEKLYRSTDLVSINFDDYIKTLVNQLVTMYAINPGQVRIVIDLKGISVDINQAIPLGLIMNELISNAMKYAFPDGKKGELSINGMQQGDSTIFTVRDNGVGIPPGFDWRATKTLGMHLVIMLTEQIKGTIELERGAGTLLRLTIPEKT
jgi:PAS domain S-box-containing protein